MNKIIFICIKLSLLFSLSLYAENKKVIALDHSGDQYSVENIPNMLITEFINGQVKFLSKGSINQTWATYGQCQDAWKLDDDSVVVSGIHGIWKYDNSNTRKLFFEPKKRPLEIHSCQPLDDGYLLIAINGPKAIIEMSPEGKIRKMIKLPYLRSQLRHQMKMVRKLDDGGYIVSASGENKVFILNSKGNIQRVIDLNKLEAPLKAKRIHGVKMLDNGNVLVGTGYGACLVEIDPNDKVVWSLSPEDVPDIKLTYVGGFQIRENGNLIIAAYDSQYPVFELTREKTIVWKIKRGETKEVNKPSNIVLIGDDIEGFAANY